ncbi:acetyltransferase [Vibrio cholerae]|nr:putative acetyltransferase [Vibrio cholerae]GIA50593.1 acetyltransferase [Vibrio cholerae]
MLKLWFQMFKVLSKLTNVDYFKVKHYELNIEILKRRNVCVGKDSIIINCIFSTSSKGDEFIIGNNCTCTGVTFWGHDASPTLFISALNNGIHPCLPYSRRSYRAKITVGDRVFIGYNSTILPGIEICDDVVVAAGTVVTKSIFESGIYGGNPARKISDLDSYIAKYIEKFEENMSDF